MAVDRDSVLAVLRRDLEPLSYVHALYEGGAIAWGKLDAFSDIDLYVVVDEGRLDDCFLKIDEALAGLARIEQKFTVPPSPGIAQSFYRLEGAGPYFLVDIEVLAASTPEKFLDPGIHGENVIHFDKDGSTVAPPLDRAAFDAKMGERRRRLRARFEMFAPFVTKELERGNTLEALDYYRAFVLNPLVEVLRMRHGPLHYSFGTRYVHRELPGEVIARLERLAYVADAVDLRTKFAEGSAWFLETSA